MGSRKLALVYADLVDGEGMLDELARLMSNVNVNSSGRGTHGSVDLEDGGGVGGVELVADELEGAGVEHADVLDGLDGRGREDRGPRREEDGLAVEDPEGGHSSEVNLLARRLPLSWSVRPSRPRRRSPAQVMLLEINVRPSDATLLTFPAEAPRALRAGQVGRLPSHRAAHDVRPSLLGSTDLPARVSTRAT